jgi:hypothetical protein
MEFEWDLGKAAANAKRHGVQFSEAATVFGDPLELTIPDPDHSHDEGRFLTIGMSAAGRRRVRIINAREASSQERRSYESTSPPQR